MIATPNNLPIPEDDFVDAGYKYDIYLTPPTIVKPKPVKVTPKPGRNDPCSCGSGKKYKKCCGGGSETKTETGRSPA